MCTELKNGKAKVQYVGYFFSKERGDSVFILPKVFIKEQDKQKLAFGKYIPEEVIFINTFKDGAVKKVIEDGDHNVIFELSVWIYRAITQFVSRNIDTDIVEDTIIQNPTDANGKKSQTMLDIILQLLDFHKKHRHLFTYVSIVNASGDNKIHWAKTINKTRPIIKDSTPYYVKFRNKSKVVNLDEELIVLFYSTLEYLRDTYNFRIKRDVQYELLSSQKIHDLIETKQGTRILKKIRRKYFTDEFIKLWRLLYTFFDMAENIKSHKYHEDRLLVKNFNIVFEDMIDYLIGSRMDDIPDELKNQADGKIVDHIYKAKSLIDDNDIYYVGDSKYYAAWNEIGANSIYKQFTYAKNIIQFNINLLHHWEPQNKSKNKHLPYRDSLTEGYNITPNFFIRGVVNSQNISYEESIKEQSAMLRFNKHFYNRLFDRDTLILKEYNINFLYVLSTYAIHIDSESRTHKLRTLFRNDLIESLDKAYTFYKVKQRVGGMSLEELVKTNFYTFAGRMYQSPNDNTIWVALEKERATGVESDREYPSIDILAQNAIVSQPLEICERASEYGCVEKYFNEPNWNVNYAGII
ncbi:LlaJI family restriction endonuclease [Bacteroides caecimuris]|uniref:LlaJI family restriction endonuclease n=2 Tax=Bacteroidia TaxID=200643 RepID=UPI00265C9478|nr:LlaJI family restriction endonuclease [Bacteroides caecimuris]